MQRTKWKTVSAGQRDSERFTTKSKNGPFCATITLMYMDWATMEHNRKVMQPVEIISQPEIELETLKYEESMIKSEVEILKTEMNVESNMEMKTESNVIDLTL